MKRILLLSSLFLICFATVKSEKSTIVYNILNDYAIQKVEKMQNLIKFTDGQANQLKKVELDFLLKVQKAENCKCCNSQKRVNKLKDSKDQAIQKILTREQYIKYDAVERESIKMIEHR